MNPSKKMKIEERNEGNPEEMIIKELEVDDIEDSLNEMSLNN